MELTPAEAQVLAALDKAATCNAPTDRRSLERHGEWYWIFLDDGSPAFESLAAKGLIEGDGRDFRLTDAGGPLGRAYHRERPDLYHHFYRKFYPAAYASTAHSRFCEWVFGEDLCQDGQADMAALGHLLDVLELKAGDRVLDLGCGAGVIAKHIADETGADVTGIDLAAPAIAEAKARSGTDGAGPTFLQGDIDALDFAPASFDAVISLDTLYWVSDLTAAVSGVARIVKPGGQLGIFMAQARGEGDPPDILQPGRTDLARTLGALGLDYDVHDYSARNAAFWRRVGRAATALRERFDAEGNGFIAKSLIRQAEEFLPEIEAGEITRYFYHVRV